MSIVTGNNMGDVDAVRAGGKVPGSIMGEPGLVIAVPRRLGRGTTRLVEPSVDIESEIEACRKAMASGATWRSMQVLRSRLASLLAMRESSNAVSCGERSAATRARHRFADRELRARKTRSGSPVPPPAT